VFGKPNVVINSNTFKYNEYINTALRQFNPNEIVELAERYSGTLKSKQEVINQVLKSIENSIESE